jgi:hypothetical protein
MLKVVGNETAQDGVDGRSLLDEIIRGGGAPNRMIVDGKLSRKVVGAPAQTSPESERQ